MAFKFFSLVPSITFNPPISYCDVCGQVMLTSKTSMHLCIIPQNTTTETPTNGVAHPWWTRNN